MFAYFLQIMVSQRASTSKDFLTPVSDVGRKVEAIQEKRSLFNRDMTAEGNTQKLNVSSLIIAFLDCFISDIVKTNDSPVARLSQENYTSFATTFRCTVQKLRQLLNELKNIMRLWNRFHYSFGYDEACSALAGVDTQFIEGFLFYFGQFRFTS